MKCHSILLLLLLLFFSLLLIIPSRFFPSESVHIISFSFPLGARQDQETPIYHTAWFLTVLALVSYAILFALLLVLYRKYKGKGVKYNGNAANCNVP